MGNLYRIVDTIQRQSEGVQGRLLLTRIGLKAGVNLSKITDQTPDNQDVERQILDAAREVLGKPLKIG